MYKSLSAVRGAVTDNRLELFRVQYRKNLETGKNLSVQSPKSECIRVLIPALQIVDDATFDAVQALLDELS
jgi:hypothetical protein|tara:strand:- start:218 stop:430 length:213 start_codon:yes stop_codon:yes gene_type:complete